MFSGSRFVAAVQYKGFWISDDGINWTQGPQQSIKAYCVTYGKGRFVGGEWTGGTWYSDDTVTTAVPVVQRIRVNGVELSADEDNVVDIPIATLKSALGIE